MTIYRFAMLALAAVAVPAGGNARAQTVAPDRIIDVSKAETVAEAIREAGYKALVKKGDDGDPFIDSAANGQSFTVQFYDCSPEAGCSSLQFYGWYKKEPAFTPALANEWNSKNRFLKAYIGKEGNLVMNMDVTTIGKTTYANFADALDWWTVMDARFADFVKAKQKPKAK